MRVGILGGTFDPVHSGHIELARAAMIELQLDKLLLIPSGKPSYKQPIAGRADRLTMTRLAAEGVDGVEVSDIEITRGGETYAVDTVKALKKQYPDDELIYIVGSDAASRVHHWKGIDKILKRCKFACIVRKGATSEVPHDMIPMEADVPEISSEQIRGDIADGKSVDDRLPQRVNEYIIRRGLYIAQEPEVEIIKDLKEKLKPSRYRHVLGVADTCVELADIHGEHVGKAYVAGLLHDCAKYMKPEKLLKLADEAGADEEEKKVMPVLHAPVGAYRARKKYGVKDEEVLSAIRKHTVGAEHMSKLDAIVYVADMVEPNRAEFPGLDDARRLARKDIFGAAVLCAKLTQSYAGKNHGMLHPITEKMINNIESGGCKHG